MSRGRTPEGESGPTPSGALPLDAAGELLTPDPSTIYPHTPRLLDAGALASVRDVDGLTPTHYAAMAGKVDNLKLLPEEYLATPDNKSNRLPIHYAGTLISGSMKGNHI